MSSFSIITTIIFFVLSPRLNPNPTFNPTPNPNPNPNPNLIFQLEHNGTGIILEERIELSTFGS